MARRAEQRIGPLLTGTSDARGWPHASMIENNKTAPRESSPCYLQS